MDKHKVKLQKKIYADYHGMRYTRQVDGKLGQWKWSGTALKSKVKDTYVNWNADVVDEQGRHQTSALSYPLVGMQSLNDLDYVEYQVLLAKAANIDGFLVEWGFPEHEANDELQKLLQVADRYDFEIGINWCDAWHFYEWIEAAYPDIQTRKDKVRYFKKSLQYVIDHVYGKRTGVLFDGHPLIFMFGGGPTLEEFKEIKEFPYVLPSGIKPPLFFGRAPIEGEEVEGKAQYHFHFNPWFSSKDTGNERAFDGAFGWIPTRVRKGQGSSFEQWDRYATGEDTISYLRTLIDSFHKEEKFALGISSVCPEMDNRGCASWGKHDLSHIPREDGETYRKMWEFNLENKEKIDIVFIVSWNDFTERHQIEPTIEDGDREIQITQQYGATFKGIESDPLGIDLPLPLFYGRKRAAFLRNIGISTEEVDKYLDQLALCIAQGQYKKGKAWLIKADTKLQKLELTIQKKIVQVDSFSQEITVFANQVGMNENVIFSMDHGIYITFKEELADSLRKNHFIGWLSFEYLDEGEGSILVKTHTDREATWNGDFSIVCDIKKDNTREWKKAKVKVFKENTTLDHGLDHQSDFIFQGEGNIKKIEFTFEIYSKKEMI
ncbi:MAG: hypothetical protein GX238_03895 [Epulopiscium sp.]|nr:hypothetical protein [Candidatus Epulonipiscium sp.]